MPGWPFRSLRVTGAMVVFTSGIVGAGVFSGTCCLKLVGDGFGVFVHGVRVLQRLCLCWLRWSVCCFDVVETSYEGHMVDALALRADEGRWSLR